MITKFAEARRTPCLLLVTQCDVSSEWFSFNKIHCRLAAPVSYRVSQKQVGCVLCGGSPLPESESSSVNLFVSFFFFLYIVSSRLQEHKECGSGGVWKQLAPRQLGVVTAFFAAVPCYFNSRPDFALCSSKETLFYWIFNRKLVLRDRR